MRLVLVHSPYLGPSSWQPTALRLRATGYDVAVPDLRPTSNGRPVAASFIAALEDAANRDLGSRTVLIGHSRSGPLLPAAAHGCRSVAALLYVDAALPYPGRSWASQASPAQVIGMRARAQNGVLPRWSDWWDDRSGIDRLVVDATVRAELVDQMPRVPSSFLDEQLPDLDWQGDAGYLQLSEPYAVHADAAEHAGWPVERRALDHLAILTAPAPVASGITTLLRAMRATN